MGTHAQSGGMGIPFSCGAIAAAGRAISRSVREAPPVRAAGPDAGQPKRSGGKLAATDLRRVVDVAAEPRSNEAASHPYGNPG